MLSKSPIDLLKHVTLCCHYSLSWWLRKYKGTCYTWADQRPVQPCSLVREQLSIILCVYPALVQKKSRYIAFEHKKRCTTFMGTDRDMCRQRTCTAFGTALANH